MDTTGQDLKVLVVDDSPVHRKLIEHTLSQEHYFLLFAKSGREAIDLLAEHEPHLIITDWMMPDLTGIELCERIRRSSQEPYTYIILLTGISEKDRVVEGLRAGADDYLTKPFHPDELSARVGVGRRIVDLHRQIEAKNRLLEELALTDSLTGLPNRRAIDVWATRQLSGAARHGFCFWVVMADLDHFKSVNDAHGHSAGDTVLKKFAEILKLNTRRSNICGRVGGEEFLLILTHARKEGAQLTIDRVRKQLEAHRFLFDNDCVAVTASFGVSGFQGNGTPDFNRLVTQADVALYAAKSRGRNRIEFAVTTVC